ncbi:MAG: prepilin-type N-terminal cleavage/methylation domain-containing protein [Sedimentisphaerales bacterium]
MIKTTIKNKGFTLAELLMAVWVMSIILAAVAALSFALGSANDSVTNNSVIYSKIRYTTMRLGEIVKNCKLICANSGTSAAIWQADYNNDSKIEPNEMLYIETGSGNNCIQLFSYQANGALAGTQLLLGDILSGQAKTWLKANCQESSVTLIDNCSYVNITTDRPVAPWTLSKKLNIFFSVVNNKGRIENYQLTEYLRCWAGYLLDSSGQMLSSDDDL